jgi:hypothetical protein
MPGAILRVGGSKLGLQRFLARSSFKPRRVYFRGEPVAPGSKVLASQSYFLVEASAASGSDFPKQLRDVQRFVRKNMRDLRALARHRLHAVVDFGVYDTRTAKRVLLSWRIPVPLLASLSKAGVEAELSLYDP